MTIDQQVGTVQLLRAGVSTLLTGYIPEVWGVVWIYVLIFVNKVLRTGIDPLLDQQLVSLGRMSAFQADLQSATVAQRYMHEAILAEAKHKVKSSGARTTPGATRGRCVLCGSDSHVYYDPRFGGNWEHLTDMAITIACDCGLFHARKGPLKTNCAGAR